MELLALPRIDILYALGISHPLLSACLDFAHVPLVWLHLHVFLVVHHPDFHFWTLIVLHYASHTGFRS